MCIRVSSSVSLSTGLADAEHPAYGTPENLSKNLAASSPVNAGLVSMPLTQGHSAAFARHVNQIREVFGLPPL